jgi:hypothetical protein
VSPPALPAGARRLFPDYEDADLSSERAPSLLISRLLEDGDASDLAWLLRTFPEAEIAAWVERHGGRQLSRRSRAFWQVVLGVEAKLPESRSVAEALWPL